MNLNRGLLKFSLGFGSKFSSSRAVLFLWRSQHGDEFVCGICERCNDFGSCVIGSQQWDQAQSRTWAHICRCLGFLKVAYYRLFRSTVIIAISVETLKVFYSSVSITSGNSMSYINSSTICTLLSNTKIGMICLCCLCSLGHITLIFSLVGDKPMFWQ